MITVLHIRLMIKSYRSYFKLFLKLDWKPFGAGTSNTPPSDPYDVTPEKTIL